MQDDATISDPQSPHLESLCGALSERAADLDARGDWPHEQLRLCGEAGVFRWFLPREWGGYGWRPEQIVEGYLQLSAACLTTTFIITQRSGACQRLANSQNRSLQAELLPALASGETFTTLAISHLTTSRQHLGRPVLTATPTTHGFVLDGYSAWVTGGAHAETVVVGAVLPDARQVMLAAPTDLPGVRADPPARLIGLSASHTGALHFDQVEIAADRLLAGPQADLMGGGGGGATGGLQTTTLAVGLASAAIGFLEQQLPRRAELAEPASSLRAEHQQLQQELLAAAVGEGGLGAASLRTAANSLVNRAAQAALSGAKGAGYAAGHPAGRWCREALFFLVWSCPPAVLEANLCELAGME